MATIRLEPLADRHLRSVHFKGGRRIDAELWSRLPSYPAPRR